MSEELYEAPRAEFSQGDIFEFLPHAYLEPPLTALERETESTLKCSSDPFASFEDSSGQAIVAKAKRQNALLLGHDCEIDKPHIVRWLISPVVPIGRLAEAKRDPVRRNRIYSMLHLPPYRNLLGESFVDFNQITTIDAEMVKAAIRRVSLSDAGRRGLYLQFIRWFTRWELRTIQCPSCSVTFNPADVMPVRTP